MNDDIAIRAENVSKRYRISHMAKQNSLRDAVHHIARVAWRRMRWNTGFDSEEFWALRNINFEIKRGEVVGIIGRNGAGKSTLLKILSRITDPSTGRIAMNGRVASLLEVGTGFHPELTGRDNIYLNGAILGMNRTEIRKKFDEIVAFAEIERFLDTPVKRYSSGMYVRLAFSVAAHLEPEILIVDEVLAVGDSAFQKKCIGKMKEVSRGNGRTVLFVSHDLAAVSSLTNQCLLLESGETVHYGPTAETIAAYVQRSSSASTFSIEDSLGKKPHISEVSLSTSEGGNTQAIGKPLEVKIKLRHPVPIQQACLSFQIINQYQQPATHAWLYHTDSTFATAPGETTLSCRFPELSLNVGSYSLKIYLSEPPGGASIQQLEQVCPFEVIALGKTILWGWRPEVCVYHEKYEWSVSSL
jgi:lipopolysaccharide transport system ATP-binding protein